MLNANDLLDAFNLAGVDGPGSEAMRLAGYPDDSKEGSRYNVTSPEKLDAALDQVVGARSMRTALARMGRIRMPAKAAPKLGKLGKTATRLARISRGLLAHTGKVESERLNRPNTLSSIYTTSLAPAATVSFTVQPSSGNSYYRVLGFIADDVQCGVFGFTSLKIGGQEHVQSTQSAPTAPVANAVPWAIFALKESQLVSNLNPWVGQVFDANTPITGIVANMTSAGASDAVTQTARMVILIQSDPCGTRTAQQQDAAKRYWSAAQRQGQLYTAGILGN